MRQGFAPVASLAILACAVGAKATDGEGPGTAPCPAIIAETARWTSARSYAIGVEFKHPGDYRRMNWESRSENLPDFVDFWSNERPGRRVRLHRSTRDSLARWAPARTPSALHCTLATRSGAAEAFLQRTTQSIGGDKRGPLFTVEVRLPAEDKFVVLFAGWSVDSVDFNEQVAMAQSLRLLNTPVR
jgi:hypothetical protein